LEKLRVARAIAVAGLAACLGAGACSQPRLERVTQDLAHSVPRTGTARVGGAITIRVTNLHVKGAPQGVIPAALPQLPIAVARFVVQPGRDRAALIGPNDTIGLVDGRILYARRKTNGPADKRPWTRLELDRLDDIDVPSIELLMANQDPGALVTLSPQFILSLLRGVLTGSVKAKKLPGGGRTISFNASVDKAQRAQKLSEDEKDDQERLLKAFAITGDIFGGKAELRSDGTLARMLLHLREQPNKQTRLDVDVDLDLTAGPTTPVALTPPSHDVTIRVGSLAALRTNLIDALSPPKVAGLS
jgi:hypothetical protein